MRIREPSSYLIMSCFMAFNCWLGETCSLLQGNRGEVDLGEKGDWVKLERVEGVDTVRMYCIKEESLQ